METIDLLIVEDSPTDAHMIERVLTKEKLTDRFHWVKDGEEALIYLLNLESPNPAVVLLDIKLPKVTGLEVLKRIRMEPRLNHLPVVMFSSSYQPSDIEAAYKLGANSYLTKPDGYSEIQEVIRLFSNYWLKYNKVQKND